MANLIRLRGEGGLLREVRERFQPQRANVLRSIGDDCAVIAYGEDPLLVTTDMLNEGIHFDLSYTSAYCLGFKLISVNVSDIYAMGGQPFAVFLDIGLPSSTTEDFFWALYSGIKEGLSLYGLDLLGGDLCSSMRDISLSATVLGSSHRPVYRGGAREGDTICVTGTLGDSSLGLYLLKAMDHASKALVVSSGELGGLKDKSFSIKGQGATLNMGGGHILGPLTRHLMPTARDIHRIAATAMIDISDGLFIDLCRLCDESGVGARVYQDRLPLSEELVSIAPILGIDAVEIATGGGEDFEMLFTVPPDVPVPQIEGLKITPIGEITAEERTFIDRNGAARELIATGYEHFKSP